MVLRIPFLIRFNSNFTFFTIPVKNAVFALKITFLEPRTQLGKFYGIVLPCFGGSKFVSKMVLKPFFKNRQK